MLGGLLAALLLFLAPSSAQAQGPAFQINQNLCYDAACQSPVGTVAAPPGLVLYLRVDITNAGGAIAIDLEDSLPAGFVLASAACGPAAGPIVPVTLSAAHKIGNLSAGAHLVCLFSGSFVGPATGATNHVAIFPAGGTNAIISNDYAVIVDLAAPLPADLAITKTLTNPPPGGLLDISHGPATITYTITIENLGQRDLYLGSILEVQDRMSLMPSSVVLGARLVGASCQVVTDAANTGATPASDCLDGAHPTLPLVSNPVVVGYTGPTDFVSFHYAPGVAGLLRVGDKIELTLTVEISALPGAQCVITPGADGFNQEAHIVLTRPAGTPDGAVLALAEEVTQANAHPEANNTATVAPLHVDTGETDVDSECNAAFGPIEPAVRIRKIQISPSPAANAVPWWTPNSSGPPFVEYQLFIENRSTTRRIRNIHLSDLVQEGIGTPPFTATAIWHNCNPAVCTSATLMPPQPLPGYGASRPVFSAVVYGGSSLGIAPRTQTNTFGVSFRIRIRYSEPRCDSLPDHAVDPINNLLRVVSWEERDASGNWIPVSQTIQTGVTTNMVQADPCPLEVTKTLHGGPGLLGPAPRIRFNTPISYDVTYSNPTDTPYTVLTLIDALRFTADPAGAPRYAIRLAIDYRYSCAPVTGTGMGTVTGYPAHNPADPTGAGIDNTAFAVASTVPQQGVRLIRNVDPLGVTFEAHSSLRCLVTLIVHPPDVPGDPYCSTAVLENAAILDMSANYNPNFAWPNVPGMWARVQTPLPPCQNWLLRKTATPSWTWPGGGPLSWTFTVTNLGPPTSEPLISDGFTRFNSPAPLPVQVTGVSTSCSPGSCSPFWFPPGPLAANPGAGSTMATGGLATGQTLTTRLDALHVPSSLRAGDYVCNNVSANIPLLTGFGSYWKNPPQPPEPPYPHAQACIPVLDTGSLEIVKLVQFRPGVLILRGGAFNIGVTCTTYGPTNDVRPYAIGGAYRYEHIPAGSHCTVAEGGGLSRLRPSSDCLYPYWDTTYAPAAEVTIAANVNHRVTVTNAIRCRPLGSLTVTKRVVNTTGLAVPPQDYQIWVHCLPYGPHVLLTLNAGASQTVPNVPMGSQCSFEEHPPVPPAPTTGCAHPVWGTSGPPVIITAPGASRIAPSGGNPAEVTNSLTCGSLLDVTKRVENRTGVVLPPHALFEVHLTCTPYGPTDSVAHIGNGGSFSYGLIPADSQCTVSERAPLPPLGPSRDCLHPYWGTAYAPGPEVTVAANGDYRVTIVNAVRCGTVGSLNIQKDTIAPPGVAVPNVRVDVSCAPGGGVWVGGNDEVTIYNIPAPSFCTVAEHVPLSTVPGCGWSVLQIPASQVAIASDFVTTVRLTNTWICPNPGIRVVKLILYQGVPAMDPASLSYAAIFEVDVQCGTAPAVRLSLHAGNGFQGDVAAPAPGTACRVHEVPAAIPAPWSNCRWLTSYLPSQQVSYAGEQLTVQVINEASCPALPQAARLPRPPSSPPPEPTPVPPRPEAPPRR